MIISETLQSRINKLVQGGLHLPQARHKHFSFIVRRNKIISFGWNQSFKSHPQAAKFGHRFNSIHSELHAVKNFPYPISELRDYFLVNVRVNPTGTRLTLAKPCIKCIYFLSCLNLKEIVYSNHDGVFVCL